MTIDRSKFVFQPIPIITSGPNNTYSVYVLQTKHPREQYPLVVGVSHEEAEDLARRLQIGFYALDDHTSESFGLTARLELQRAAIKARDEEIIHLKRVVSNREEALSVQGARMRELIASERPVRQLYNALVRTRTNNKRASEILDDAIHTLRRAMNKETELTGAHLGEQAAAPIETGGINTKYQADWDKANNAQAGAATTTPKPISPLVSTFPGVVSDTATRLTKFRWDRTFGLIPNRRKGERRHKFCSGLWPARRGGLISERRKLVSSPT